MEAFRDPGVVSSPLRLPCTAGSVPAAWAEYRTSPDPEAVIDGVAAVREPVTPTEPVAVAVSKGRTASREPVPMP